MAKLVLGWLLDAKDRAALLTAFPPAYGRVVAHHVTLRSGVAPGHPLPRERAGRVVGIADDGRGVQALVVELGGSTDRPDGSTYHITWSLADGRRAVESNQVIREHGWRPVDPPRPVRLEPALFA